MNGIRAGIRRVVDFGLGVSGTEAGLDRDESDKENRPEEDEWPGMRNEERAGEER